MNVLAEDFLLHALHFSVYKRIARKHEKDRTKEDQ